MSHLYWATCFSLTICDTSIISQAFFKRFYHSIIVILSFLILLHCFLNCEHSLKLLDLFYCFVCLNVLPAGMSCTMPSAYRGQEKIMALLGLKLEMVASHISVLGFKPWPTAREQVLLTAEPTLRLWLWNILILSWLLVLKLFFVAPDSFFVCLFYFRYILWSASSLVTFSSLGRKTV